MKATRRVRAAGRHGARSSIASACGSRAAAVPAPAARGTVEEVMSENMLPVLMKHPFVADLETRQLAQLATIAKLVKFPADHTVSRAGDRDTGFYLIVKGMVALEIDTPEYVVRVQTLDAGDEFGWSSVAGRGAQFQVRTLDAVEAIMFDATQLLGAFKDDPALGLAVTLRLLTLVSERFDAAREHLVDKYSPVAKRAGN
jgi:CRP/FNR family cyclic AMP-dependent transcriptional regulator